MLRSFLVLNFILICLQACSPPPAVSGDPTIPTDQKLISQAIKPMPSVINVPLHLRTKVVEEMINSQLMDTLFSSDTLTLGSVKPVKVRVYKSEPISLNFNGDELSYRVPLRIWMQFQFTVGAFGMNHTEYQAVEANIALKFKSRLFVKNDWKIVTMTGSDGYDWVSDPVMKVRFLTIPVKPLADMLLSNQQRTLGGIVDKAISEMLDVRTMLQPLWKKIQQPIELSSSPQLWLKLQPLGVNMTQLEGSEGVIRSAVGIKSIAETFFGDAPATDTAQPLPEFVIPGKSDSGFVINLYTEITYENAAALTRSYLQGKNFATGKYEVIVLDVNIYGQDGYAVVSLDLTGSYRGKVYMLGKIHYDTLTSVISIEDLEFDLTTKNGLHNTLENVLHNTILTRVKPFLRFPIKEKLLESQLMIQKMLCNQEIAKNVFVSGTIDSLAVGGIRLTDTAIQALILAKGDLSLEVRE